MTRINVLQVQNHVYEDKDTTLKSVEGLIGDREGLDLITLGEMFQSPYDTSKFQEYGEEEGGKTYQFLSQLAKDRKAYVSGGSIPELDGDKIYNTAYVFDRKGELVAKHRKIHLFDIDVEDGQYFKESDTLTPGDEITVFDTDFGRVGLMICYDIRFVEVARVMAMKGVDIILVPGAFNMTTGPAHWRLSMRARALDNQAFVIGTGPARDYDADYLAWGHSLVCDPWGAVLWERDQTVGIMEGVLDLDRIQEVRESLPILKQRRPEIYQKNLEG